MGRKLKTDLIRTEPQYPDQVLKFTIPIPPSVNHIYQSAGRRKRLTTEATNYIKTAQDIVKAEIRRTKWKKEESGVWQVMDLYFYYPDLKVRDSHNTLKILTDSLEGMLFSNDYFLLPRIQMVRLDRENPRLEVVFYPQREDEKYAYRD